MADNADGIKAKDSVDGIGHSQSQSNGFGIRQDSKVSDRESFIGHLAAQATDLFHPNRKVGVWGVFLIEFYNVSGGPWGSEPIVASAGPLPGFICLLIMAVFWGLPLCLVTSEMSSALPNNGGYTLWVDTAFGAFWGFQESWWSWTSCVVDNALYPVLAYETFIALYQGNVSDPFDADALEATHSWWIGYFAKLLLTLLFSLPVLLGKTEWITKGMGIMLVLLTLPFAIMLPYIMFTHPMDWSQLTRSRPQLFSNPAVDWIALIHVTFWNFNGFDCVSTCAGEVRDPGKSFPRGTLSALVAIVLMTGLPLVIATAANTPEWENWDVGWWSAIANQCAGINFAWSVVFSSLIGTFGMHAAVMWEDAWQLCGMAEQGLAPRWLAKRNEHLGTPQNATILSMLVVMSLIMFDFRQMVIVDNFFSVASGLLEIAAFAHLKRTRPEMNRPFNIPGIYNDVSLFLFLLAPVTIGFFVLFTSFDEGWTSVFTLIPFVIIGFLLPTVFKRYGHTVGGRKGVRGLSISRSEPEQAYPQVGGVYGAFQLSQSVPPSPMRPAVASLGGAYERESIRAESTTEFPTESTPFYLDSVHQMEEGDGKEHIFGDDMVQWGSIFTDPKLFRNEDDEFLSAVGRRVDLDDLPEEDELNEEGDDDDEEEQNPSPRRRAAKRAFQKRRSTRDQFFRDEAEFLGGTDEERSYDEASLD